MDKGTEKMEVFKYLNDLNKGDAEGEIPFFPYSESDKIDDFICYDSYDDDSPDDDTPDDVIDDKEFCVTTNDAQIDSSFKDSIKNVHAHIIKVGNAITTNNGLTAEVLGMNGYLSVAPLIILLHYIGSNLNGYAIDFGGGYGYAALLITSCTNLKLLSVEINYERFVGSLKLQNMLANEVANSPDEQENYTHQQRQKKMIENTYFMYNGDKSSVSIDWTLDELNEIKTKIFGVTNNTLTPRTASVGVNVPELIKNNVNEWKFIYFFSTGWSAKDISDVLDVITTFPNWIYFFTDMKPQFFKKKDILV